MNPFAQFFLSFFSNKPAAKLIRKTARDQWRLIVLNLASNLLGALSEGATLGIVFLAVNVLTGGLKSSFQNVSLPFLGSFSSVTRWLDAIPATWLFLVLLGLAVCLQVLQSFSNFLNQLSMFYFSARCRALITAEIYSQILRLNFSCASNYKVGELTDHAIKGPIAIRIQIEQLSIMMAGALLCLMYLVVLIRISPLLILAVVFIGWTITLLQKNLLPKIRAGSYAVTSSEVVISTRLTEDFQGLRLLHSTGQLDFADRRMRSGMGELESHLRSQAVKMSLIGPVTSVLPILAIALVAAISILLFGGSSTGVLPSLVTFVLALQKLNGRINILNSNLNALADNGGRFDRLNDILTPEDKSFRRRGGIKFQELKSSIKFEDVCLRYLPDTPPSLIDISFQLNKGELVALVGCSGAGKSSIADLLTGLYEPTSGCILVDNIPMQQIDIATWQQRLGVVSQDTFLFNATIAQNISFGTPSASQEDIEAACKSAQAHGFIESLDDGYDTLVGERGFRLSGGQRQRLSLARAILRNPELLILDEATSALDSQSERLVQEAIERFESNHSVLVIAHRLSTIMRADQILVLDSGRVIERGTHKSLLAAGGVYRSMWMHQESEVTTS
jgi:subfamily B ATP-binding cassette protein MsbA